MKKPQIILLFLLISAFSFAQHEFAPIGAEWYYNRQLNYNPPEAGYEKITSIKDSIIENKTVRVLEKLYVPNDTTHIIEGYEYLYQSGDTIWYWKNNEFHMLYNFSMHKGDSILLYSEMKNQCESNEPYGWNKVDSIYTQSYNGLDLKVYTSIPINNSVWGYELGSCEIFGNLDYLIPQNVDCVNDGIFIGPLRCYSDPVNGILVTSLPEVKCDSTYTYNGQITIFVDEYKTKGYFEIYPNPVINTLNITNNSLAEDKEIYGFKVINAKGQILKSCVQLDDFIDVSDLKCGTYFILFYRNKKLIDYERFIKI